MKYTLLTETLETLKHRGYTPEDVICVFTNTSKFSWEDFAKVADVEYDGGYGAQEVAEDLQIMGKDWWMDRHEYDGSECWVFHAKPDVDSLPYTKPNVLTIRSLSDWGGWMAHADIEAQYKADKYLLINDKEETEASRLDLIQEELEK